MATRNRLSRAYIIKSSVIFIGNAWRDDGIVPPCSIFSSNYLFRRRSFERGNAADSGKREKTESSVKPPIDSKLLEFLQLEVKNEERTLHDVTLTGFRLPMEQKKTKLKSETEPAKETTSASVFFLSKNQKKPECIFCKSNHDSQGEVNPRVN